MTTFNEPSPHMAAVGAENDSEPLPGPIKADSDVADFQPGTLFYLAFATLAVLTLIVALDSTSISVALPTIAQALNGTALEAFWTGTAFLLTSTVFQPNLASFSHIFGRKPMLMISIFFFLGGVLVAGLAQNFTTLLVGRSIQGVGGGGLIVLTEIVVCDLVPLRLRGQYFGIISGTYAIGTVSGPLIGGAFAQYVTWRWILWINLPFIGAGLIMVPSFIKLRILPTTLAAKLAQIDWIGSILFIASTTGVMIPISWGGVQYDWSSWHTLVPLLVSLAGFIIFYLYEEYVATEPVIRMVVFKNRNAAAAYFGTIIHSTIITCLLYYMPLYYEAVKNLSPTVAGVALFPETFTVAPAAIVIGIAISKSGRYRWAVWSGWTILIMGLGILQLMDVDTTTTQWIFLNIPVGIGAGFLYPALNFVVQAATSDADMAFAVAMFTFFRQMGQTLGVAIGGVVFQNQIRSKLLNIPGLAPMADVYAKDVSALVQIIKAMPESTDRVDLVKTYADSLKTVYAVLVGLAGLALVVSFLVKHLSLDRLLAGEQLLVVKPKVVDQEKAVPGPKVEAEANTSRT